MQGSKERGHILLDENNICDVHELNKTSDKIFNTLT
jgi:hypothetical protein